MSSVRILRDFLFTNKITGCHVKLTNLPILSLGARAASILGISLALLACSEQVPPVAASLSQEAQLIQMGSQTARMCVGCHGPKGISRVTSYPSIAGQPQAYLADQLRAFRDGTRENPMMSSIAKSMDDEAILALSHYFASLPGPVETEQDTQGQAQ